MIDASKPELALKLAEAAIATRPQDGVAHEIAAWARATKGEKEKARGHAELAEQCGLRVVLEMINRKPSPFRRPLRARPRHATEILAAGA